MALRQVVPNLYQGSLGFVNVYILDTGDGLALFDTGIPGSERKILNMLSELGKTPGDLRAILITHLHIDHVGALAALHKATGAPVYMHGLDADEYLTGNIMRPVEPSPGWINAFVVKAITRQPPTQQQLVTVPVSNKLSGGEIIEAAGGVKALHTPGHTAGHLAYLWPQHGGVLIAGDLASHMVSLGYSFLYENFHQGQQTIKEIASLPFEVACFAHGRPIRRNGALRLGALAKG